MTKYRPELLVRAEKADPQVQVIDTNGREVRVIEFLAGLDAQLINGQTVLEDRLKKIPSAWRNFRLAATMTKKVLDELYKTLPPKTLLHMQRIRQFGEVIIRPRPACKLPDDVQIVDKDDKDMYRYIGRYIASRSSSTLPLFLYACNMGDYIFLPKIVASEHEQD